MTALVNHGPETLPQACLGASEDMADPTMRPATAKLLIDRYCQDYPVRSVCLATGIDEKASGIWGGYLLLSGRVFSVAQFARTAAYRNVA